MINLSEIAIGTKLRVTTEDSSKHDFRKGDVVTILRFDHNDKSVNAQKDGTVQTQWLWGSHVELFEPVTAYVEFPLSKTPSTYAKYCYSISKQLGEDGSRILRSDLHLLKNDWNSLSRYANEDTEYLLSLFGASSEGNTRSQKNIISQALVKGIRPSLNDVYELLVNSYPDFSLGIRHNLGLIIPFVRMVGSKPAFDFANKGMSTGTGDNRKELTIKAFGRKFGLNKWECWPVIAEKLKQHVDQDIKIKYFTKYEDLRKYYMDEDCSGESCMRYDFGHLSLHPCAIYAHDINDYAVEVDDVGFYVSPGIKLAVLFEDGEPTARVMVNTDSETRGKSFGSGASTLTKMLGFSDCGVDGCVNIIKSKGGYIMAYIDGSDKVDEDSGEIGTGSLGCAEQDGFVTNGIWSEYEECTIPEGEEVWSERLDSYIYDRDAVSLHEGGHTHEDDEDLHFSRHEGTHFTDIDDWVMFEDDWYLYDNIEDVLLEHIRYNSSISELLEFAEGL